MTGDNCENNLLANLCYQDRSWTYLADHWQISSQLRNVFNFELLLDLWLAKVSATLFPVKGGRWEGGRYRRVNPSLLPTFSANFSLLPTFSANFSFLPTFRGNFSLLPKLGLKIGGGQHIIPTQRKFSSELCLYNNIRHENCLLTVCQGYEDFCEEKALWGTPGISLWGCAVRISKFNKNYYYTVRSDDVKVLNSRWNFVKTKTTTPGNNIYTLLITLFIAFTSFISSKFQTLFFPYKLSYYAWATCGTSG